MKYRYVLSKDNDTGQLIIKEHAELSKEIFSMICESNYDVKQIEEAMAEGDEAVAAKIRTPSFYPPGNFLERIAQSVTELLASGEQSMVEVYCDDTEFLAKSLDGSETFEKLDDEEEDADDFIDDDLPDDFDGAVKPGVSKPPVAIDDDAADDGDD
jgi:hypothetical protein